MTKPEFKTVKTGPVSGPEPDWIHDLPKDNLVAAITALGSEVYILRERLRAMERELVRRDVLPVGAVEGHAPTSEERDQDLGDLQGFVTRLWSEIARSREPWSSVKPGVEKFFKQPE